MIDLTRAEFDVLLRSDFVSFVHRCFITLNPGVSYRHSLHIEAIAFQLQRCQRGECTRLIIAAPPRSLKSICVSVAYVAWLLGHDPTAKIIAASYSQDLAIKLHNDTRTIMRSEWYRRLFPGTRISREKDSESEIVTTRRGFRLATSVGGTLTGRGGDLIVIDDAHKPTEAMSHSQRQTVVEWFRSTAISRLDDKRRGGVIVVGQRVHRDDLTGQLLGEGGWTPVILPAIAEVRERIQIGADEYYVREVGDVLHAERESRDDLERMKVGMGSYAFEAQYQQCPVSVEGQMIKREWFQYFDEPPKRTREDEVFQSWDTAVKASERSDYSVCTTVLVKGNHVYVLDVFRERLSYPDLRRIVVEVGVKYRADVTLIEDKGSGSSLIQELEMDATPGLPNIIGVEPWGDKATRMYAQTAFLEAKRVHLPRNAPWLDDYLVEMVRFPDGGHDDQVDSLSQLLDWIQQDIRDRPQILGHF